METGGFQFGRRIEDQLDFLRALVAQGRLNTESARARLSELESRLRNLRGQRSEAPRRRWSDPTPRAAPRVGDPARRRRLLTHIKDASLAARFAGLVQTPDRGPMPFVAVDGEQRPDVADLPRVFRLEDSEGDARSRWLFVMDGRGAGYAVLIVSVARPVHCRFRLLFDLAQDRALLALIGRAAGFALTCVDPAADKERAMAEAMFVAVPGADVLSVLAGTQFRAA